MSPHNICFYKRTRKNYSGCNLKPMKLLDCALIGACAVIRGNMVCLHEEIIFWLKKKKKRDFSRYMVHMDECKLIYGRLFCFFVFFNALMLIFLDIEIVVVFIVCTNILQIRYQFVFSRAVCTG